jgi:hypothetical protein
MCSMCVRLYFSLPDDLVLDKAQLPVSRLIDLCAAIRSLLHRMEGIMDRFSLLGVGFSSFILYNDLII